MSTNFKRRFIVSKVWSNLHWVLLPSRLLNLGPSERLNSCQRLIPRSFDGEQSRS